MSEIKLKITGMTCDHCVAATTKALQKVAGVEKAEVTLQPGGAVVLGNAPVEALIASVAEEGYLAEQA